MIMRLVLFIVFTVLVGVCSLKAQSQSTISNREFVQYNPGLVKFALPEGSQHGLISDLPQLFLYHKGNLLMQPDGTGRVYMVERAPGEVKVTRLDSTIYFGFTFGSYLFLHRDSIYSLGGYGYWKYNGLLRTFIKKKGEWELEKLNREVPVAKTLGLIYPIWRDPNQNVLWLAYYVSRNEGTRSSNQAANALVDSVLSLDLRTRDWTTRGQLADTILRLLSTTDMKPLASSPWGQLILSSSSEEILQINYARNRLEKLDASKTYQILKLLQAHSILHFADSNLVIQSGKRWLSGDFLTGDTVILTASDFRGTGSNIYTPKLSTRTPVWESKQRSRFSPWQFLIGILIGGGIVAIAVMIRFSKTNYPASRAIRFDDLFDEREKELIRTIKNASINGAGTSIDEVNKILGIHSKNIELQKKHRSEIFISINEKWRQLSIANRPLIEKRRLDFDKRSYQYYISKENIELLGQP
jgi:hypothetical protein